MPEKTCFIKGSGVSVYSESRLGVISGAAFSRFRAFPLSDFGCYRYNLELSLK